MLPFGFTKKTSDPLSAEMLQKVLESSYDGILITDPDGQVLMHNRAYVRLISIPLDDIVGLNLNQLLKYRQGSKSAAIMAAMEKKTVTLTHTDIHSPVFVTSSPVFDEEGNVVMVITNVRDLSEIMRLREELQQAQEMEKIYYNYIHKEDGLLDNPFPIAFSPAMKELFNQALKISGVDVTVLITGESGTGKEVVARYIHEQGLARQKGPFIAVNCGAIPDKLLESELFGYAPGAFTGAFRGGKAGLFESAQQGTIFLDEIGELPPALQVKLLRVIESRTITRLGSIRTIPVDVRILAASNSDLEAMVPHRFRQDLYYRLNVVRLALPPLRQRLDDIIPLAMYFLNQFNRQYQQNKRMGYHFLQALLNYDWPGNIRELRNTIERMVVLGSDDYLEISELPGHLQANTVTAPRVSVSGIMPLARAVEETERQLLNQALQKHPSIRKAAAAIEVDHSTAVRKMKRYGIAPHSKKDG